MPWLGLARTLAFLLYFGSAFYFMMYFEGFRETTLITETRRVSFGHYEVDNRFETRHTNPKKRKQEAWVCLIYLVLAIPLACLFLIGPW
ncbi:hypothetical protein [Burkholderia phage FLC9]|nr:hypothetical protein [Burkholderia phage FLC9]